MREPPKKTLSFIPLKVILPANTILPASFVTMFTIDKRAQKMILTGSKNFNDWIMRTMDILILAECYEFAAGTAPLPTAPPTATIVTSTPAQGQQSGQQQQQQQENSKDLLQAAAGEDTPSPQGSAPQSSQLFTPTPCRHNDTYQVIRFGSIPPATNDPLDQNPTIEPKADVDDPKHKARYELYLEFRKWISQRNIVHALINMTLDHNHRQKFRHIVNQPYRLWTAIQQMYENQSEMAGPMVLERLLRIKYEDFPTAQAWLTAQDNCRRELAICDYEVPDHICPWLLLHNLPPTEEWEAFKTTIGMMKIRSLNAIINHILEQESRLAAKPNEKALFVTKREAGKRGKDSKTVKKKGKGDKKDRPKCMHCRRTNHVTDKC
jgi:hypothetical protein